jgi:predicted enzyme related to lactoylglutathione lyase
MKVTGIDATYYTVMDVTAMKRFYSELLGAAPETEWEGRLAEWSFSDGSAFGIYGSDRKIETRSGSAMFAVDDVAKAVEAAKARGVKFAEEGEITDTPVCHMAFGEDTEGNQFILHHRK